MKKMVLLFGEFKGNTMQNNSFYTWKVAVKFSDAYFAYLPNERNKEVIKTLSEREKRFLVPFDSKKHIEIYKKCEMMFVSLTSMDTIPTVVTAKANTKPIIYMQHGVLGMKKVYYTPTSYNNYLYRFVYFNKSIKQTLIEENFEEYQLEYMEAQPRYVGLAKKANKFKEDGSLLVFLTWREQGNEQVIKILDDLNNLEYNGDIKVVLHDFVELEDEELVYDNLEINMASKVDVQELLCKCSNFLTDYSSVIWDAAFLGKSVYLYCPDYYEYYSSRDSYIDPAVLEDCLSFNKETLELKLEQKNINTYFHENMENVSEFSTSFIEEFVLKMIKKIEEKIIFIGYGFYGIGGTITATKAIAQRLLEKGMLVECYSLTKNGNDQQPVPGLIMKYNFDWKHHSGLVRYLKRVKPSKYFRMDQNSDPRAFNAFTERRFKKYLEDVKGRTIVSTREAYNIYVYKYSNISDKKYIFNTDVLHLLEQSPGIIKANEKIDLEQAIFVSDSSKKLYSDNTTIELSDTMIIPNLLFKPHTKKQVTKTALQYHISNMELVDENIKLHFYIEHKIVKEASSVAINLVSQGESKVYNAVDVPHKIERENLGYFTVDIPYTLFKENSHIHYKIMINNKVIMLPIRDVTFNKNNGSPLVFQLPNEDFNIHFDNMTLKPIMSKKPNEVLEVTKLNRNEAFDFLYTRVCCAFRVSVDRMQYIEDLIILGEKIKDSNANIIIDVFGSGNAFDIFSDMINHHGLEKIIFLKGHSNNIIEATKVYDIQISLSKTETFGMTYIEAILNGKKVFTFINEGSMELFKDYNDTLCTDHDDLINKVIASSNYDFTNIYSQFESKYLETDLLHTFLPSKVESN